MRWTGAGASISFGRPDGTDAEDDGGIRRREPDGFIAKHSVCRSLAPPAADERPSGIGELLPCVRGETAVGGTFLGPDRT
jgi:hypothetical protein